MKSRLIFSIIGLLVVVCGVLFLSIYVASFYVNLDPLERGKETLGEYQVSSFNELTNETSKSIVRISRKLSDSDYISFRSSDNSIHSTVSKISDVEYECHGRCYCEDEGIPNRRNVNVLSKSLYFVISAISLSLAINIAKDYFKEQCNLLSRDFDWEDPTGCKGDKIIGDDIDYCEVSQKHFMRMPRQTKKREYFCKGHCMKAPYNHYMTKTVRKARNNFGCKEHYMEKVVEAYTPTTQDIEYRDILERSIARTFFVRDHLNPFCKTVSEFDYLSFIEGFPDGKYKPHSTIGNFCVGQSGTKAYNYKCKLIREKIME